MKATSPADRSPAKSSFGGKTGVGNRSRAGRHRIIREITGKSRYGLCRHRDGWVKTIGGKTKHIIGYGRAPSAERADEHFKSKFPELAALIDARRPESPPPAPKLHADLASLQVMQIYTGPCVYFLLLGRRVVYVGKTFNLTARIAAHKRKKKFDRVAFVTCEAADIDAIENRWIDYFKPSLNREFPGVGIHHCGKTN